MTEENVPGFRIRAIETILVEMVDSFTTGFFLLYPTSDDGKGPDMRFTNNGSESAANVLRILQACCTASSKVYFFFIFFF